MIIIRRIVGKSMLPHMAEGRLVVALRFMRPSVGDVVIARHNGRDVIKRVGDIRKETVYLLGDNPTESTDSRHFGWLPLNAIQGIVIGGRS